MMINEKERIYVAGHRGMVGSAIVRGLVSLGCNHIITRSHSELDLTNQAAVKDFFEKEKIDRVVLAAAKVGGIYANNIFPADFIYQNLMIQANVCNCAYEAGIKHLLFLGSSCIYPKFAPQPMKEEYLLTGKLEQTNEPYAIAKIAGIKLCESYNRQFGTSFRSVMPTNLFGPGDNYHLENSHVVPAMIRKYHLAKLAMDNNLQAIIDDESHFGKIPDDIGAAIGYDSTAKTLIENPPPGTPKVVLWGTGTPRREFLHVDDMATGCIHVMNLDQEQFSGSHPSFVNIGCGKDITIRETAEIIGSLVGYRGETIYNSDKPDGTPQKLLDITRIKSLGWRPEYSFREGLENAYQAYLHIFKLHPRI